jgi:Uma2 family endonuclease
MATATLMTSAEFLTRPDEFDQSGNRIKEELIGGEIVKMAEPSTWHDVTKNNIGDALALHLRAHPELGLRSLIEIAFEVTPNDTFRPDVAVVRMKRLTERRLVKGSPEIAVEVISPTDTVDRIREKIAAYLENGASAVWIFYRDGSVAVHTIAGVRELKGDQLLEDSLLPGFSVPVSTLYFLP